MPEKIRSGFRSEAAPRRPAGQTPSHRVEDNLVEILGRAHLDDVAIIAALQVGIAVELGDALVPGPEDRDALAACLFPLVVDFLDPGLDLRSNRRSEFIFTEMCDSSICRFVDLEREDVEAEAV